jgi:hypothetical protein
MYKNYKVSVDIYPRGTVSGLASLLHIWQIYGERNPAIFFHDSALTLRIYSDINGNKVYGVSTEPLSMYEWTTVVIQQQQGQF